jgi:DNA-binding PadR family transcriptional regulator
MMKIMENAVDALILDLLEWVASRERTYRDVLDAWRTSCPRLPVWEDANDRGLVRRERVEGRSIVTVTAKGFALLEERRKRA